MLVSESGQWLGSQYDKMLLGQVLQVVLLTGTENNSISSLRIKRKF